MAPEIHPYLFGGLPGIAGSMRLSLNGDQVVRTENSEPYALFGDLSGDFFSGIPLPLGENSIEFDVYSRNNLRGRLLDTINRTFTVIDDIQ